MGPIAENRAFVRCVRNFLKINIVAQDELGNTKVFEEQVDASQTDPKHLLERIMKEKSVSFKQIVTKLTEEGFEPEKLTSINDIPKTKIFELIQRIKNKP